MRPENVGAGMGNSLAPSLMVGSFGETGNVSTGKGAEQPEDESKPHGSTTEDIEMKDLQQAEDGLENGAGGSDYDSLFGDEDGEKEGEDTDDRPSVKASNANTTSSVDVQPRAGTEGFDFPFDGPLAAATATNKATGDLPLPLPPRPNSTNGKRSNLLGGKQQGLPVLTPAMYRQFSDDVMLASGIDGEVALHDRRIGGDTLVGRLESSEKTPPWCMSVSGHFLRIIFTSCADRLTFMIALLVRLVGMFLIRWPTSDCRTPECESRCVGYPSDGEDRAKRNAKLVTDAQAPRYVRVR
jgi:transcriptional activator SPT8